MSTEPTGVKGAGTLIWRGSWRFALFNPQLGWIEFRFAFFSITADSCYLLILRVLPIVCENNTNDNRKTIGLQEIIGMRIILRCRWYSNEIDVVGQVREVSGWLLLIASRSWLNINHETSSYRRSDHSGGAELTVPTFQWPNSYFKLLFDDFHSKRFIGNKFPIIIHRPDDAGAMEMVAI